MPEERIEAILETEVAAYGTKKTIKELLLELEPEEVEMTFEEMAQGLEQQGRI